MNNIFSIFKNNHETVLYAIASVFLLMAIAKPQIQLKQAVHNYLLLADVSQSMNAEDVKLNGKNVSRMSYTRHLMKKIVETSPCGTYISIGIFAGENVAPLFMPLEVCKNYDVITDTIDHLEWRMAWRGNSRLSFGIKAATSLFDSLNAPAQMLFFTDGEEAPKVNAINKLDLSDVQIGKNLVFVGIGGHDSVPVPRYNSNNKWVGYWSTESKEISGGTGASGSNQYNDTSQDEPDPVVASAEYDRYLSFQDADYLKLLASEVKGTYIEGTDTDQFYDYVQTQKPAANFVTDYSVRWIYLTLAAMLILLTFLPSAISRWKNKYDHGKYRFGSPL